MAINLGNVIGPAAIAEFNGPSSVAIDVNSNMHVTDRFNNLIKKITSTGTVSLFAGSTEGFLDGSGINTKFCSPNGITVNADGNVYVADTGNNRIRKITQ